MNQANLNGKDLYLEFHLTVFDGFKKLLVGGNPLPGYALSWPDEDGKQYDLDAPVELDDFEGLLDLIIEGDTIDEVLVYQNKYTKEYRQKKIHSLHINSLNQDFKVLFGKVAGYEWVTTPTGHAVRFKQAILRVRDDAIISNQEVVFDGNG